MQENQDMGSDVADKLLRERRGDTVPVSHTTFEGRSRSSIQVSTGDPFLSCQQSSCWMRLVKTFKDRDNVDLMKTEDAACLVYVMFVLYVLNFESVKLLVFAINVVLSNFCTYTSLVQGGVCKCMMSLG